MENLIKKLQEVQNFLNGDVYEVVGIEAENFYRQSFRNEGFTYTSLEKWADVKCRTNPRPSQREKASAGRPILTDTGLV